MNSKTGKLVWDTKSISLNYILYGRFWIDLTASLPLELLQVIISTSQENLRFFGLLKMVRLLRLGRMISFLRSKQRLQFSMKIIQILFFLFIIIHWINCLWSFLTTREEVWFPPKDLDSRETKAYEASKMDRYFLFYYYGILTLVGNELLPVKFSEILAAIFLLLLGTVFIGAAIGEFTNLISNMTK